MELKDYFANTTGYAILATADSSGKVDLALYSRPHFMDDGGIAFIMADRLTHYNLQSNRQAAYMFIEAGGGYKGKRLILTRTGESADKALIDEARRKSGYTDREYGDELKYLVYFRIDKVLPLVGESE
ncbi:MAG TPA: pyridoxamine 5'-phosphate oxidase [Deltaproteobacteria bacterium]|nr:pyridoxamine 5'-phosphate oxidase [Deltaproteobacteria bacterium]